MRLFATAALIAASAAAGLSMPLLPSKPITAEAPRYQTVAPANRRGKGKSRKAARSTRGDKKRQRRAWANAREFERQMAECERLAARAGVARTHFYKRFGCLQKIAA